MNRYNIYYQVHKGLREMLYHTASLLQQTDFTNQEEAAGTIEQLKELIFLFDKHAHTEDHFILPAIVKHKPSAATLFEEEHVQDQELGNRMSILLHIFNSCTVEQEQLVAAGAIRSAFIEFMIFNLQHMAKEEIKLNELLWKYYTDEELKNITVQIVAQLPPDVMGRYSTWMIRALNNTEITNWLKEIKNNAPDFIFSNMMELAEKELPANRWMQVQENMTEGALLA